MDKITKRVSDQNIIDKAILLDIPEIYENIQYEPLRTNPKVLMTRQRTING